MMHIDARELLRLQHFFTSAMSPQKARKKINQHNCNLVHNNQNST